MSQLSFERTISRFVDLCYERYDALYSQVDAHVGRSIRFGSAVTGAPGQPVRSGKLLRSWRHRSDGKYKTYWTSNARHARIIEHNLRGAILRSRVGGFHSVKLTAAGFRAIVRHELRIVKGEIRFDSRGRGSQFRGPGGRWVSVTVE